MVWSPLSRVFWTGTHPSLFELCGDSHSCKFYCILEISRMAESGSRDDFGELKWSKSSGLRVSNMHRSLEDHWTTGTAKTKVNLFADSLISEWLPSNLLNPFHSLFFTPDFWSPVPFPFPSPSISSLSFSGQIEPRWPEHDRISKGDKQGLRLAFSSTFCQCS